MIAVLEDGADGYLHAEPRSLVSASLLREKLYPKMDTEFGMQRKTVLLDSIR